MPLLYGVGVAISYGVGSMLTTLGNKAVLSTWTFDFLAFMLFTQNIFTVAVVYVCRSALGPAAAGGAFDFPLADRTVARMMLPVAIICLLNVLCGLGALTLSSVPVYQTLKRMSPLPAMIFDAVLRRKRFSLAVRSSVLCVCLGALIAGCGDLDLNFAGYSLAISSCVLQVGLKRLRPRFHPMADCG